MTIRLPYDIADEALARATWSRLAEPADRAAVALVAGLGACGALQWLTGPATDSDGEPSPCPPLPLEGHDGPDRRAGRPEQWARAVARWTPRLAGLDIRREMEVLERLGGSLILPADPWWPPGLDELDETPFCLWVRGDPALLVDSEDQGLGHDGHEAIGEAQPCPDPESPSTRHPARPGLPTRRSRVSAGPALGLGIALVGARDSTRYGEQTASGLAAELTAQGALIISGGAFGIDAAAHRGALGQGPTMAVSAGGVDRLYPAGNAALLEAVIATGALVAEVPPGCQPGRHRFLTRNRLIAAISQGVVVVEAAWRSGALSTAHHAQELGRPVGAVPGPVTSMASVGCHRLLRSGAVCVTDAQEVIELVGPLGGCDPEAAKATDPRLAGQGMLDGLDPACAVVMDALPARSWAVTEAVVRAAGLSTRETIAALGLLELLGRVERGARGWKRTG